MLGETESGEQHQNDRQGMDQSLPASKEYQDSKTQDIYNQEVKNRFSDADNGGDEPIVEEADSENELDFYHKSPESKGDQTFEQADNSSRIVRVSSGQEDARISALSGADSLGAS